MIHRNLWITSTNLISLSYKIIVEYKYKNINVFYDVLGKGSHLIVFLHGWGASSQLMMPIYRKLEMFDNDKSYLFIDFPPFGKSNEPIEPWNLDDYVNLTEELISKVDKIEKVSLIGHSFGGRVAIKLASKRNDINNLILLSSAGIKPKFSLKTKFKLWKYKFYKKINSKKINNFGSRDYKILSPIMKKTFNNIINEDLTNLCGKISSRTLIIFGKKDKETPLYMGKILNKKIKESKLIVIKNGDHFTYLYHLNSIFPIVHSFLMK